MSVASDPRASSPAAPAASRSSAEPSEPARLLRTPLAAGPPSLDDLVGLALEPGTRDVARRLFARGASAEFVRSIVGEVRRRGGRGAYAIDRAAVALAGAVPVLASPPRSGLGARVPMIALVGPSGVGKTTVLVELGRKMRAAGRRVAHAGLDPATFEALEQRAGAPGDGRDVAWLDGELDAVLFDTPGLSPREPERLARVARDLARRAEAFELRTLVVLSAAASRSSLALTLRSFAAFRACGAILTRLDETDEPAPAFEALARARLPLALLCEGRDGRASLVRATPATLPDLFLGGAARRRSNR